MVSVGSMPSEEGPCFWWNVSRVIGLKERNEEEEAGNGDRPAVTARAALENERPATRARALL
jgi:hypothetical protein